MVYKQLHSYPIHLLRLATILNDVNIKVRHCQKLAIHKGRNCFHCALEGDSSFRLRIPDPQIQVNRNHKQR